MAKALILEPENIPTILKTFKRWQIWKIDTVKSNGKFGKVPIDRNGNNCNANDASNWLRFDEAVALYTGGKCDGIGIALSDAPIDVGGQAMYLIAVDLDNCMDQLSEMKILWKELGRPYVEISPSGNGLRMFAFSRMPIKGGNAGQGREMYGSGRFMTVTGVNARGRLIDATDALLSLQDEWFPLRSKPKLEKTTLSFMGATSRPETTDNIRHVRELLSYVSADCEYDRWRNVVWSILSTGFTCAVPIAREWSETSGRFTEAGFENVVKSFKPQGGINLGTLHHMAQEGGWKPAQAAQLALVRGKAAMADSAQAARRFDLLTVRDLQSMPPMQWRIKRTLPARGLAAIYGPSGSGKSFLAIDLGCSVACGLPTWFGAAIKPAPVVYVALEGEAGIRQRIAAWAAHHQRLVGDMLRIVLGGFTLTGATDATILADEVVRLVGKGAIVIVDTLNQSAPGGDENSSVDMGMVLANAKALATVVDGVVVLVHHAGKDASKGMRGHSSLYAAMDAVIEVTRGALGRTWKNGKLKEEADGGAYGFDLVPYIVGQDEDGEDVRSCAVVPQMLAPSATAKPAKPPRGKNQLPALQALQSAAVLGAAIKREDAIRIAGQNISCDSKHRSNRATEALEGLIKAGHLIETEGGLIPA